MSNNPWPFVVVSLASLGFLASSMAQQNDQPESGGADAVVGLAAPDFGELRTPDFSKLTDDTEPNRWSVADETQRPDRIEFKTEPPVDSARLGSDIQFGERQDQQFETPAARRPFEIVVPAAPRLRMDDEGDRQRIDVAQVLELAEPIRVESPTPASQPYGVGDTSSQGFYERAGRSSATGMQPPGSRLREAASPERTDYETASFGRDLFPTANTSLQTNSNPITANTSRGGDRATPATADSRETRRVPTESARKPIQSGVLPGYSGPEIESPETQVLTQTEPRVHEQSLEGKLPLIPTMALFASLAANLFFGWIAYNTHSRYREFMEEMAENETRMERQSRRLRSEPTDREESRTRRRREEDRAEFLQGGLEV